MQSISWLKKAKALPFNLSVQMTLVIRIKKDMTKKKNLVKRHFDFCVELPAQFRKVRDKTETQKKIEQILSEIVNECSEDMFLPSYNFYSDKQNLAMILKSFAERLDRESRVGFANCQPAVVASGCGAQLEDFISEHIFWEKIHSLEGFSRSYFECYGWESSYSLAPYVERLRQHAPLFHKISEQAKHIAIEKRILLQNAKIDLSERDENNEFCYPPRKPNRKQGLPRNVALWERMGIADINVSIFYGLRSCFWQGSFDEVQRLGDVFMELPEDMFLGSHSVCSFFEANVDVISGFRDWISTNAKRGFFRREAMNVIEDLGLVGVVKSICVTALDTMVKGGLIEKETVSGLVFFRSLQ